MPDYRSWLEKGLEKDGVTAEALAEELGLHRSAVYKMLYGERKFRPEEIPVIARVIKEAVPKDKPKSYYDGVVVIPIQSIITAAWQKPKKLMGKKTAFVRDMYDEADFVAYRLDGEAFDSGKITTGDDLVCVSSDGTDLEEGMLVVVRNSGNISLRKVEKRRGKPLLRALTRDQELSDIDKNTTVIAVAVQVNRPL